MISEEKLSELEEEVDRLIKGGEPMAAVRLVRSSARRSGMQVDALIRKIVELGLERGHATPLQPLPRGSLN